MHASITPSRIVSMVKRGMHDDTLPGVCLTCGRTAKQPCEPDARQYPCLYKTCEQPTVYGAEEVLFMVQS